MMLYSILLAALPLAFAAPLTARDVATKYIVVLKPDASAPGAESVAGNAISSIQKEHVYDLGNFKGFSAVLTEEQISALRQDSSVAYISVDAEFHTTGAVNVEETKNLRYFVTQNNVPSWGLGRVSSRDPGSTDYVYHPSGGEGTCAYIVDTGIYAEHPEFEGRAESLINFVSNVTTDDNGHGTHVSGTIGSKSYGVAKKTKLFGVKVLNQYGSGTLANVIAGVTWAAKDSATRDCPNGAVLNLSLGGSRDQSLNDAVAAAVDYGVFVSVSAGNSGINTDAFSPSSEPKAFTVGATDRNDNITYFSNYGALVDLFAPGSEINSTWIGAPDAWEILDGTSMASPHAAGLGAYLLGIFGKISPAALGNEIKALSTKGAVKNIFPNTGTPNFLIYNGRKFG